MTVKELSEYLKLDKMTIYKMLKEETIPASRIGHQWSSSKIPVMSRLAIMGPSSFIVTHVI